MAVGEKVCQVDVTSATKGSVAGLSTSDTARLKKAFPGGPQWVSSAPSTEIDGVVVNMTDTRYRSGYKSACLTGISPAGVISMGANVDMSYGTSDGTPLSKQPPTISSLVQPQFPSKDSVATEAEQGNDGSTIASSGRGPNVNPILTLDGIPDPTNTTMADPKPAIVEDTSPDEASAEAAADPDDLPVDDMGSSS